MAEHVLKVVPPYFDALVDGSKTFEVRRNDRGYQTGDRLVLWEYDPTGRCDRFPCETHRHRMVERDVTYVYAGDPRFHRQEPWPAGCVVLGLAATSPAVVPDDDAAGGGR
jgi:hypothetical protein